MVESLVANAISNTFFLGALTVISVIYLSSKLFKTNPLSHVDRYEVSQDARKHNQFPTLSQALHEAYPKFRNKVFMLGGIWRDTVVVPPKFIEGLKALPEHQLSFFELNNERFDAHLTKMKQDGTVEDQTLLKSVMNDLTRHLTSIMKDLDDEIRYGFSKHIPACEDWTEVYPAGSLLNIVALASGRVFVGYPLNRDEDFLKCTIMFTIDAFGAAEELRKYPSWTRRFVAPWLPQIKRINEAQTTMNKLMRPLIKERMAAMKAGKEVPSDMTTWNIQNAKPHVKYDAEWQAHAQLLISLAAIHTTTMTSSHTWLDLAAHPECIAELREEIEEVLGSEPEGILAKTSMPKLKKLDSFIKESQRTNPLGMTSFDRKVTSDLTLPDGTVLPKGTVITVASNEIGHDPDHYKDPYEFDPFRFVKLRAEPGNQNKYQFATTGVDSMYFGHGKHSCPGRFFAANEIKLFLVHLIMGYDIKLPEGQSRPKNIESMSGNRPDHTKPILLKKRNVAW